MKHIKTYEESIEDGWSGEHKHIDYKFKKGDIVMLKGWRSIKYCIIKGTMAENKIYYIGELDRDDLKTIRAEYTVPENRLRSLTKKEQAELDMKRDANKYNL